MSEPTSSPTHGGDRTGGGEAGPPLPAKDPLGFARVAVLGVVWALLLLALAVVAAHDVLVRTEVLSGSSWVERSLGAVDGEQPRYWWVIVAVPVALLGLALIYVALRPRPYLGRQLEASTGVFLLDRGLRRLAEAVAEDTDGVDSAQARGSGRTLTIDVRGLSPKRDSGLESRVGDAVRARLESLRSVPHVRVRDRER